MANETHPECYYDDSLPGYRVNKFHDIDKRIELGI